MGVSSYFEFITVLFGWIIYDNIYAVLAASGVVFIPFVIIIFKHIVDSRKGGDDEGSAGLQALKKVETDLIIALFVLLLAVVPAFTVTLSNMQFVKHDSDCQSVAATISGNHTGTTYDNVLGTIGGQAGGIPVWWGGVHVLTKSIISAAIASIPCTGNMAAVNHKLASVQLKDDRVNLELQEFMTDCYMPAKALYMRSNVVISPADRASIDYLGSDYFMSTLYANRFYSRKARPEWPFDPTRDGGYEVDAPAGHPTCAQWWGNQQGLRNKLLTNIEPSIMTEFVYHARNLITQASSVATSPAQREDIFLKRYLGVKAKQANISGVGEDLSVSYSRPLEGLNAPSQMFRDAVTMAVAGVGAAASAPAHLAGGMAVREGASIFLSLALMVLVCVLPILLIFSVFDIGKVMTLTCIFFALHFVFVIFSIAYWIDNSMTTALMSGSGLHGVFSSAMNPTQLTLMAWVQRFTYMLLPALWMTSMTWIGFRTGSAFSSVSDMSNAGSKAAEAGPGATKSAVKVAMK